MVKVKWPAGTLLAPVPPVLVSSGSLETPHVMTAAWTGIICTEPVLTYVSIRPSRLSHEIIEKTKALPCDDVDAPQIAQAPLSLACKVLSITPYGTHDMFLAEVKAVYVDDKYLNEKGALSLEKAGLLAYAHGFYYTLGRQLGKFGFSVEKPKTIRKRRAREEARKRLAK